MRPSSGASCSGGLVDQAAARDVHKQGATLAAGEGRGVEQVACFGREVEGDDDGTRARQHVVQSGQWKDVVEQRVEACA
jgi:hypothetical protein